MKMLLCTAAGAVALLALMLFVSPVRARVEGVMCESESASPSRTQAAEEGPLSEAAAKAGDTLQKAWDGACGAVRKKLDGGTDEAEKQGLLGPRRRGVRSGGPRRLA